MFSTRPVISTKPHVPHSSVKSVTAVILGMSKAEVVKWSLDNSFELIEMMSKEEEEDDEEGINVLNQ